MLKIWDLAPAFQGFNDQEQKIKLADFRGRYKVVYFFPKAFTPGCTKESCSFSDNVNEFQNVKLLDGQVREKAVIIGISPDKPSTLATFRDKYGLKLELISDPEREIARDFQALKENGRSILRSTFILDRWGRIRWSWYGVTVKGHVEEVLEKLKEVIEEDLRINPQISWRRAYRALSPEAVSRLELERLITSAHLAPSCMNKQPWRFKVIDHPQLLGEVHQALSSGNYWMQKAPVLIAVYSWRDLDCKLKNGRDYFLFDTGLAVGQLLLQATQMGLVAHPVAGYDQEKVKELLKLPPESVLITIIAVAYPGSGDDLSPKHQEQESSPRERLDLAEVMSFNLD